MNQVVTANVGRETPLAFELDFFFFFAFRLDLKHQFLLGLELAGLWADITPSAFLFLGLLTQTALTLSDIPVFQLVSCGFGDFSAFIIR